MRKLLFLSLFTVAVSLAMPAISKAQTDSTCQIFGTGGNNIVNGQIKRFYTKYTPGAIYGWSLVGSNAVIVGPRNLHYVDVQGQANGSFSVCLAYSVNGQAPCCLCINGEVTPVVVGGSCCIYYVNSTLQDNYVKIKFRTCSPGVVLAKLFRRDGDTWTYTGSQFSQLSGLNPDYTYNVNLYNISCWQIFCLKVCGYLADGTECCTANFSIMITCDQYGNLQSAVDYSYPGCNAPGGGGGGGGIEVKNSVSKPSLKLTPNPATSQLQVVIPEKSKVNSLQITDRNGTIIRTVSVKGQTAVTLTVTGLKTGTYYVKPDDPAVEASIFVKQ